VTRTAAYLRISKDEAGQGLGIERQRQAVTTLAESKGWRLDPRWVINENDTSAWDDSKPRPGFERLLQGMESGQVEAVVVYSFDRLARRLRDTVRVLDLVEKHAVEMAAVTTGALDLSSAYGRGLAGVLGSLASMEIAAMSDRLKAKAEENAKNGRVTNGGRRPFGYDVRRMVLDEGEAAVIREVANGLLAGESLTGLVRGLNDRQMRTAYGSHWTLKKLRGVMSRPALCGRVTYRGDVLPGVNAAWPAILDEETFDKVQVALAARTRLEDAWTNRRRHLLSGLAWCGIPDCGAKMIAFKQTSGKWAYRCSVFRHLSRDEANLDAFLIAEVKARADETTVTVSEVLDEEQHTIRREISDLEARKYDTAREFADGSIPADVLRTIIAEIEAKIAALRERQVDEFAASSLDAVCFSLDDFDSMDIENRRTAITMFVRRIVVHPPKRMGRGFDPTSVEIVWRDLDRYRWYGVVEK
jgi:site-specific DNA recombinase